MRLKLNEAYKYARNAFKTQTQKKIPRISRNFTEIVQICNNYKCCIISQVTVNLCTRKQNNYATCSQTVAADVNVTTGHKTAFLTLLLPSNFRTFPGPHLVLPDISEVR